MSAMFDMPSMLYFAGWATMAPAVIDFFFSRPYNKNQVEGNIIIAALVLNFIEAMAWLLSGFSSICPISINAVAIGAYGQKSVVAYSYFAKMKVSIANRERVFGIKSKYVIQGFFVLVGLIAAFNWFKGIFLYSSSWDKEAGACAFDLGGVGMTDEVMFGCSHFGIVYLLVLHS